MQKVIRRNGMLSSLLPLGLVVVFALSSLALALMGGRAYREIQDGVAQSYDSVIASSYLRTKLSQDNLADAAELRTVGTYQVLVLARPSQTGTGTLETRIYVDNGYLKESFGQANAAFDASLGVPVAAVRSCTFDIDDNGLFTASIVCPNGDEVRSVFALAQGGGA